MCLYVSSEVILVNLLAVKDSVSMKDIVQYCEDLKKELWKRNIPDCEYLYFNNSQNSIDNAVERNVGCFRKFGNEIYADEILNANYFNLQYSNDISEVLICTAKNFATNLTV